MKHINGFQDRKHSRRLTSQEGQDKQWSLWRHRNLTHSIIQCHLLLSNDWIRLNIDIFLEFNLTFDIYYHWNRSNRHTLQLMLFDQTCFKIRLPEKKTAFLVTHLRPAFHPRWLDSGRSWTRVRWSWRQRRWILRLHPLSQVQSSPAPGENRRTSSLFRPNGDDGGVWQIFD